MAKIEVVDRRIEVVLSGLERLGALRGDVSVGLGEVLGVHSTPEPFAELHGWRAPGTGLPGVIALGTWRARGGKDFVAVYRGRSGVVVDVRPGGEFRRLVVTVDDAAATLTRLRTAVISR